jgi:hypothetical protein
MGDRLGIIAGAGEFPLLAAAEAGARGFECVIAAIRGEADDRFRDGPGIVEWFEPGEISSLSGFLKSQAVSGVLIAGKIRQEAAFRPERLDAAALFLFRQAGGKSPVRLIAALIEFLEGQGLRVLDPMPFLNAYFCSPGTLTRAKPDRRVLMDIEYGLSIAVVLADLDIGQTLVVKDRAIIAIEGIEGTDRAILRGGELAGPGTVVIKAGRSHQDPRIDLPAVGLETIRTLIGAEASALAFDAEKLPFFQREAAVALADDSGIVIVAKEGQP